jgi:hypothetical protein
VRRLPPSTIALVLGVSSLLLTATGTAIAAPPVPEDFSGADQYVESLPTSRGSTPARSVKGGRVPLPSGAGALPGDERLERIATSTDLGAPRERLKGAKADRPGVPMAAVSAVGDSGGDGFGVLVAALALITGVVAGIAGHRHYRNRLERDA